MRTVVTNREVAQLWSNQEQSHARNGTGSYSFDGPDLYSYSTRIGHICSNGVALLSENTYSNTTAQHISAANSSSRKSYRVPILDETDETHKTNMKYYLSEMKQAVLEFSNARSRVARWVCQHNQRLYDTLQSYCRAFGLDMPITLGLYLNPDYPFVKRFFETRFYKPDGADNWREVFLPKWLADKGMANVEPKDILKTRNAEIRREIIRIVGIERICHELKARTIDRQDEYELVLLDLRDGRRRPFLKMHNPSVPEIWHVEGVHPCLTTVQDALNYRRYGDEMLEPKEPNDEELAEIFDRVKAIRSWVSGLSDWPVQAEIRFWKQQPENQQIRQEYRTTPMFGNPKDWKPEVLT